MRTRQKVAAIPFLAVLNTAESDALAGAVTTWMDVRGWRSEIGLNLKTPSLTSERVYGAWPRFELKIRCDATETITSPQLYAVEQEPVTISDDTFTSSGSDAVNTAVAHGMLTGDGPFQLTTTTTLPAGLLEDTDYWVEKTAANTFELYTTLAGAIAAGGGVATTDTGTGTHTIVDVQSATNPDDNTQRRFVYLIGDLNEGTTITVGAQAGYKERIEHSPLTTHYYVVGTSGTGAQTVTVEVTPVTHVEE